MADSGDLAAVLLELARDDATALKVLVSEQAVADAVVGFHAQQAVEKTLKAALAATSVEFPLTHDLEGLMELCSSAGLDLPDDLDGAETLSPVGVTFRYGALEPSTLDRGNAVRWAETAVDWATGVLEDQTRPSCALDNRCYVD